MSKWDVIIVGAGFGGLCTGALLAHAGKRVLVLEKDGAIGGRAKCFNYKGQVIDDGAHVPTRPGHLEKIFADLGLEYPELLQIKNSEIYHEGIWKNARELYSTDVLKIVIGEMMKLTDDQVLELDDIPLDDWVESISEAPGLKDVFFYLACSTSVGNRLETYSAGEMAFIVREILNQGLKLSEMAGVIKGGVNSILEPLADYINSHGGEVRLNSPVDSLALSDNRAVGVNVEVGERIFHSQLLDLRTLEADFVIVTAPLWEIFSLLDEDCFPNWWVDWVNWISAKVSHVWSNIYGVDEPFFDSNTFRWAPELPHSGYTGVFIYMPSYGDDVNQHQFHALYQGHYDEFPDLLQRRKAGVRQKVREFLDLLEQDTFELYPQLKDNYHWKIPHVEIYNIAQSPGLVGSKKPSMKPPGVNNLYLVSYTVQEARGVGMQAVARNAIMAAEAIINDKNK